MSFPRIFRLLKNLGLRHVIVVDNKNQVRFFKILLDCIMMSKINHTMIARIFSGIRNNNSKRFSEV